MLLSSTRLINSLLAGLSTGVTFSHLLQASTKKELPAPDFLKVQTTLYNNYGAVAPVLEGGTLLSTLVQLSLVRGRRPAFPLSLLALSCMVAELAVWVTNVNPINKEVASWTPETMPEDWAASGRDRWHFYHNVRLVLWLIAFSALLLSEILDKPAAQAGGCAAYSGATTEG
jgi:hypothetical protein